MKTHNGNSQNQNNALSYQDYTCKHFNSSVYSSHLNIVHKGHVSLNKEKSRIPLFANFKSAYYLQQKLNIKFL
jgi:hypothetical protein